ncbi:MAG: DHHA1 domain protein [Clostridiales bacterium 38_11]|nr:MAG: DHHA1 domain protein [Clostridiales bacterium 38_11]HBH12424.1 alanyl-tRNA editing protein [Clostridiales bacterium]
MTIKLFEKDVYKIRSECRIQKVIREKDRTFLVLDKTIFFPEGGGQPSDKGTIGDSQVIHVSERDGVIYHHVDKVPVGESHICELDWDRRFDHMQQHCGEHILSGVIMEHYGYLNKGFHLGESYVSIDIDGNLTDDEQLLNIETLANKAIYENRPVIIDTVDSVEKAMQYHVRKMPNLQENLRIVYIADVDSVACCGTHPARTGEVGILKILKVQRYKKMTRLFFKCGLRALQELQKEHQIITELSVRYSADLSTLIDKISQEKEKYHDLKNNHIKIQSTLASLEADNLIKNIKDNKLALSFQDKSIEAIGLIIKGIQERENVLILASSLPDKKIILANNGKLDIDCGQIIRDSINRFNGKGGGSKVRAQATFEDLKELELSVQHIKSVLFVE